ncbi:MAG: O-antigen ligase family protein [Pseudobdellovibrionaceae bacterium]
MIFILLLLIFASKLSLAFVGFPVDEWSYFIFQKGLHPVFHAAIVVTIAFLFLKQNQKQIFQRYPEGSGYQFYVRWGFLLLAGLSFLQYFFNGSEDSLVMLMAVLLNVFILFFVYGIWVPKLCSAEKILAFLKVAATVIVVLSLGFYLIGAGFVFKGGRFVGIMKHIPHMVTVATLAFNLWVQDFLCLRRRLWALLFCTGSFWCLLLTGTRSALLACLAAVFFMVVLQPIKNNQQKFWRWSLALMTVTFTLFFSKTVFDYTEAVILGKESLMNRQAQDGVETRWDEVRRGLDMFEKSSWLGLGLLSKYNSSNAEDSTDRLEKYNSQKDPHNFVVSAGVIGGWVFLIYACWGLLSLLYKSIIELRHKDENMRFIAIYLLTQWPILLIYHVHLSVGGMADRVYWLLAGLLFLNKSLAQKGV